MVEDDEEHGPCNFCNKSMIVTRKVRDMRAQYDLIASGDKLIKDALP
jgi:hypothetical protein